MNIEFVQNAIKATGIQADIRGAGKGMFVFAESHGRAVEISLSHDGRWWVEFWGASEDEDAPPERDAYFDSADDVIAEVKAWLVG